MIRVCVTTMESECPRHPVWLALGVLQIMFQMASRTTEVSESEDGAVVGLIAVKPGFYPQNSSKDREHQLLQGVF